MEFNKLILFFIIFQLSTLFGIKAQIVFDSVPASIPKDSLTLAQMDNDTIKLNKPKEALEDIVTHTADDYIAIDFEKNITTLYNNAKLHYQDVDLEAGVIIIDFKNELIKAHGIIDSLGYSQIPFFKQAGEESHQDSLLVNYKTERALIWGLKSTQQNGMLVSSEVSKKVNDSTIFVKEISVTTSDKTPRPDYYIDINKAKIIPKKRIVAGWSQLYIADVPTPAVLPFAYFPLTQTRTSGILVPTWGESGQRGYFLQNGGYYLAISDYFDLALTGDIYTNGSWAFKTKSEYALKYRYKGSVSFTYENNINSLKGFDDYSNTSNYSIRWSHAQDAAANPNASISANVNLSGNSNFYRQSLNEYSSNSFLNNTMSSSINFSKRFVGTPFNLNVTAMHTQNTNTKKMNMTLPTLVLNMDRIYPFAPKNGSKKNALHKISLNYNLNGKYEFNTNDDEFMTKKMFEEGRKGLKHTASLSTSMKWFKFFNMSPNANYNEYWYFDYISKAYDANTNRVVSDTIKGFQALRDYSFGIGLSTNIYGTFRLNQGRLKAIRHTLSPSVSYSFRPDFSYLNEQYYNPLINEYVSYSPFESGMYGRPQSGISNNIGISIRNTFEAKIMEKDPEKTEPKKVTLLNNLNFSTGYDITRDSLRWSNVGVTTGLDLFKKKLRMNFNASLDPYAINAAGRKIEKFNIENGGSLFRLTNAGISMSYSLNEKSFVPQKEVATNENSQEEDLNMGGDLKTTHQNNNGEKETKTTRLYYADIPWNISFTYSLQYTNSGVENKVSSNSLMISGDTELSPKWKVGFSSGYDFKNNGVTYTQLRFNRDLDSWQMSFNWVPFGNRQTYYFYIGVKSGVLSDLKYDKQSLPDKTLF